MYKDFAIFNNTIIDDKTPALGWLNSTQNQQIDQENCECDTTKASLHFLRFRKSARKHATSVYNHREECGSQKVNVWIATKAADDRLHNYYDLLSEEERMHAARIRLESARRRYISARILLRFALSYAVNSAVNPFDWRFSKTAHGKPEVAAPFPKIHFSVTHNEHISVVVTSASGPIGVDAEEIASRISHEVRDEFFSLSENKQLEHSDKQSGNAELVRLWTMKEAYSKMIGLGFSADFRQLDFARFVKGPHACTGQAPGEFAAESLNMAFSDSDSASVITIVTETSAREVNLKVLDGPHALSRNAGLPETEWRRAA